MPAHPCSSQKEGGRLKSESCLFKFFVVVAKLFHTHRKVPRVSQGISIYLELGFTFDQST